MQKHIVIIEHDEEILETMRNSLEKKGYVVSGFTRFTSMAELVFMHADCFIIEEWLPQVSGHAICLMLKAKVQTNSIPVILASTVNLFEPMANLCQADAIVGKPLSGDELVHIVSSILFNGRIPLSQPRIS